ncbi:hypothetical protein BKA57DRAFT_319108 [Linnemannia elongata]|nr:hypothetical protein BKA57DRAFT_319108 [Linnemannia elongata]
MVVDASSSCLCYVLHTFSTCPYALPTSVSCLPVIWSIYPSMSPICRCRAVLPPVSSSPPVYFLSLLSTCPLLFALSLLTTQPFTLPSSFFLFSCCLLLPYPSPLLFLTHSAQMRNTHTHNNMHIYILLTLASRRPHNPVQKIPMHNNIQLSSTQNNAKTSFSLSC